MIKRLICWCKAIPFFIRCGEWLPHNYSCKYDKVIIIANDKRFRVSSNYEHGSGETVYKNACLLTYTCKCCGNKQYAWYRNWDERVE